MVRLINDLEDTTRVQMGVGLDLDRRPTDVVALVRRVVEQQQAMTAHQIHVEAAVPILEGPLDADRVERVVANLLSNAVKYSPGGGHITVQVAREDEAAGLQAVIAVRDEGVGIPAADVPLIFERFHRAGNIAGRIKGTGIGLASVRRIVEQHGGTISVDSQEGAGSTFTVRLPLTAV
jgi:signal transduction histidine kinase